MTGAALSLKKRPRKEDYVPPFWTMTRRDAVTEAAFVAPKILDVCVFVLVPLCLVFWYSLHEWNVLAGIRLAPEGLAATVELVEPMGGDTQITARLGDARLLILSHDRVSVRPGEALSLHPPPATIHLFDAPTGTRLEP